MSQPHAWAVVDARSDIPSLYQAANSEGALEWQSMKFWKAVFDAWKDSLPYAMTINDQIPPDFDANSLGRLRRVDYAIDFYDSDRRNRSFTLIFIEGKGANTGASVYDMVEAQAHNACETYAKAPGTHSNLVYAMCTVGTRFRFFVWRASGETDGALITLIGDKPNGRADEYIDAADREKGYVFLKALRFILANAPATFADRSILAPNFPEFDAPTTVPSHAPHATGLPSASSGTRSDTMPAAVAESDVQQVRSSSTRTRTMVLHGHTIRSPEGSSTGVLMHHGNAYNVSWAGGRNMIWAGDQYGGWREWTFEEDQGITFTLANGHTVCLAK